MNNILSISTCASSQTEPNTLPMKTSSLRLRPLAAAILGTFIASLAPALHAQTTATTDPVGFITLNVEAASATDSQLSFKALGMCKSVEYQGSADIVVNGTNSTFTSNNASWANDQYNPVGATAATATYYLEIVRPTGQATPAPGEGTTYDIIGTSSTPKTITVAGSLPAGVVNGALFKIRKYWTIGDVFGTTNTAGLGGGAQGEADDVLIFNPTTGQFDSYYYRIGGIGGSGWRNSNTGALAADQKIYPDDGIVIRRRQQSAVSIVVMGAVKTGASSIPVFPNLNYLGNVYAADMTLGSSGLYTGDPGSGVVGGAQGEADDVLIYDPATKSYKTYYYRIGGIGGSGWRSADDGSLAASVPIPVGTSIVVRRRAATGFNWVAPQHPSTL
jgi:hypothetical protein